MIKALQDPIVDDGISFTSYFNGRLLSSEDLARDQQGNREARRRLGQAIGEGVAFGLEMFESPAESSKLAPIVTVQPGVAVEQGDPGAAATGKRSAAANNTNSPTATKEAVRIGRR